MLIRLVCFCYTGQVHSGSPFRLMLEDSRWRGKFVEFAAQGNQCAQVRKEQDRKRKT